MGATVEETEVGGGEAQPLGEDFAAFLSKALESGMFENAGGQTQGIAQALNELVAGPDVTGQQSAVQEIIQKQSGRDVADLRERFTAGGGSQGTPSAVAEGLFRSETAPRLALATGQLDLAANQQRIQGLIPILQALQGFASRGVSQRTAGAVVKPGILSDIAGITQGVGEIVPG